MIREALIIFMSLIKSNLSALFGIKYNGVTIWNKILNAKLQSDRSELS